MSVLENSRQFGKLCAAGVVLRLGRVAVLLVVGAGLALGQDPGANPPSDANSNSAADSLALNDTLEGVVLNSVTHEPVARALVSSVDNRFATMTDGQGHFEFKFPRETDSAANRPTALVAKKPGYLTDIALEMQLGRTVKEISLSLAPEGLIVGHVSLPSSEAADKIQVQLYRKQVEEGRAHWVPGEQASTRSNGDFRFADLAAGTYKVMTLEQIDREHPGSAGGSRADDDQMFGYPPVYFPSAKTFAGGESITLGAGQIFTADLDVVRQPYFAVRISVTNAPPNIGMGVNVSTAGTHGPGFSLGYNPGMHVIEGALPQGSYLVEGFGFGPPLTIGESALTVHTAPLSVSSMTMVATQSIAVNVKEEFSAAEQVDDGNGLAGVRLSSASTGPRSYLNLRLEPVDDFIQHGGATLRPPMNLKDESLMLEGVVPGRYWVHVDAARGYAASVSSGGRDLLSEPLVVGNGSAASIEITMRDDTAEVSGTIEGAEGAGLASGVASGRGAPLARVFCVPMPDSAGKFSEVATSPQGAFTFLNLPPGAYRVLAFKAFQPSFEYRNPEVMRALESSGPVIHLTSGQKEHITVPLAKVEARE